VTGFSLLIHLLLHSFSLKKNSMRKPGFKRILLILFVLPLLALIIAINKLFLLLDDIFFRAYRKQKMDKIIFIVGMPRSATSLIFRTLASDPTHFNTFKLWELALAPSLIQKYIFNFILSINAKTGKPLHFLAKCFDDIMFRKMRGIHDMSWNSPEEDEILLVYKFSTILFEYVFPGLDFLDDLLAFDDRIKAARQQKLMQFYKRCLQRHQYVFNRSGKRFFLSKNPGFISRLKALKTTFPESKLIFTYRSPGQCIAATVSLNRHIYNIFTSSATSTVSTEKTVKMLIRWYKMSHKALEEVYRNDRIILHYNQITQDLYTCICSIYTYLSIELSEMQQKHFKQTAYESKLYKSANYYTEIENREIDAIEMKMNAYFQNEKKYKISVN